MVHKMWTNTSTNTSLHEAKMVEFQWNKFKEYIMCFAVDCYLLNTVMLITIRCY